MALTVIFALVGSMLLSLTLMPVLASLALPKRGGGPRQSADALAEARYRPVLAAGRSRTAAVVLALAGCSSANAAASPPSSARSSCPGCARAPSSSTPCAWPASRSTSPSATAPRSSGPCSELPRRDRARLDPHRHRRGRHRPDGPRALGRVHHAEAVRAWTRAETQDELVARCRPALEGMPGMRMVFTQPIEMRMNEMIAGIRADVGVKLFGDDFDVLRDKAARSTARSKASRARPMYTSSSSPASRCCEVEVDRAAARALRHRRGRRARVGRGAGGCGGGRGASRASGASRWRCASTTATSPTPAGRRLLVISNPAASVSRWRGSRAIEIGRGPLTIQREWGQRRITVQANVRGRDVGSFVADAQPRDGAPSSCRPGYYVRFGGQFEHLERAQRPARDRGADRADLLIFVAALRDVRPRALDALRVFTGCRSPRWAASWRCGCATCRSAISAAVGFVALSGVAVLGDMVLVSHHPQLTRRGPRARATRCARRPSGACGRC
jgi:cobalt-zinc-cadmium resistance protein CzcA